MIEIIDLTGDRATDPHNSTPRPSTGGSKTSGFGRPSLNRLPIGTGELRSYNREGFIIRPGVDVELDTGQCMRVRKITQPAFGKASIKGIIFERTEQYAGCFTVSETEVCMSLNSIRESHHSNRGNTLVSKPMDAVIRLCDIIITNLPSVQSPGPGILVCRWKVTNYHENEEALGKGKTYEVASECFRLDECDEEYRADSEHLLLDWRDDLKKGGSVKYYLHGESEYLRSEQLAANAGNRDVSFNDLQAARSHMRRQAVSKLIPDPNGFRGDYGPASDEDELTEQWSRPVGYVHDGDDDDECEELMLASVLLASQPNASIRPKSRKEDVWTISDNESDWSDDTLVGSGSTKHSQVNPNSQMKGRKRSLHEDGLPGSSRYVPSDDHGRSKRAKPVLVSRKRQRYTFGDAFCGAGGVSRGAVTANIRVKWACDFNVEACQAYCQNFYESVVYQYPMKKLLEIDESFLRVDILHLSPPCQFFSPAHTRPGPDDEMNLAAMYCISLALQRCKPRIVTLEETSGLQDQNKHKQYFRSLVRQFADNGYSFRWGIFRCCNWGVPQRRRRLFLIAAW